MGVGKTAKKRMREAVPSPLQTVQVMGGRRLDRAKSLRETNEESPPKGWQQSHMAAADLAPKFREAPKEVRKNGGRRSGRERVPVVVDEDN